MSMRIIEKSLFILCFSETKNKIKSEVMNRQGNLKEEEKKGG